uniref:NADH-ubiquinone oxidoreductase chain 4L n=1 Tax=Pagurus sp. D20M TaxID=1929475 RepID=A0A2Z5UYB4_9EUCA|nr:NADH dehydrogenase subunit 4L [Pagurus sp. D20M]
MKTLLMMILNNGMILVSFFMVFSGLWSFVSYRKHLLNTLLSLEFIMLGIFFFMNSCVSSMGSEIYFVLFFLTLAACEGALGLSLLVSIVRSHGNDYFNSFMVLGC